MSGRTEASVRVVRVADFVTLDRVDEEEVIEEEEDQPVVVQTVAFVTNSNAQELVGLVVRVAFNMSGHRHLRRRVK